MSIGIDVDGVLGDQITEVLPRIQRRLGISVAYEDITDWRLPVGTSDIAKEIERAFFESDYIANMPVHNGAVELLKELYPSHRIVVLTARPQGARHLTERWLWKNHLWHDELVYAEEATKSARATSILIDDYLGNIVEFLTNTSGVAVLVDRPWNQGREEVQDFLREGRLLVVSDLADITALVRIHEQMNHLTDRDGRSRERD